jgi:hypothetical protein
VTEGPQRRREGGGGETAGAERLQGRKESEKKGHAASYFLHLSGHPLSPSLCLSVSLSLCLSVSLSAIVRWQKGLAQAGLKTAVFNEPSTPTGGNHGQSQFKSLHYDGGAD